MLFAVLVLLLLEIALGMLGKRLFCLPLMDVVVKIILLFLDLLFDRCFIVT